MAVSAEHGFPLWLGVSRLLRSWSVAGTSESGVIEGIRRGMTEQVQTGNQAGAPVGFGLLADTYLLLGDVRHAAGAVEAGLALSEQSGTRVWDAELHRLRGEIHLRHDPPNHAEAERSFREALATAQRRGMKMFELRSAVRLARLMSARGRHEETEALRVLYRSFTEGFDTPGLAEARAFLEG